jgi:WD40 repeat protein
MGPGDIRTMLLEKIGPLRKRLVGRDRDEGDRVVNPFIEKVADYAQGLPLYVTYVIGDILNNRFRALDVGERLPESLSKYHEELLKRCAVGVLHQVLTPLAATIAVAKEPLTAEALADLLVRRNLIDATRDEPVALVKRGLAAIASMLRRSATPDGAEGFTLYHHSLQQHMEQSPEMAGPLGTARAALAEFALAPGKADAPAAAYLYRHGVAHLVETGKPAEALGLLCRFDYLMDRLQALQDARAVPALAEDWRALLKTGMTFDRDERLWEAFFREREHILRRGNECWPAYKILLQLAVEHADDSPVTAQAEAWLARGNCDWVWFRNPRRVLHAAPDPCLRVLEGHTGSVLGALLLPDGRILSWSVDKTLRLWSPDGAPQATLEGHTGWVVGALLLPDARILSWSRDGTLRSWSAEGTPLSILGVHDKEILGARLLPDGHILSCSEDGTLGVWNWKDMDAGRPLAFMSEEDYFKLSPHANHQNVLGNVSFLDGDGKIKICKKMLDDHFGSPGGVFVLGDGRILVWGYHGLRLWDCWERWKTDKGPLATVFHSRALQGAIVLENHNILSWSDQLLLSDASLNPISVFKGNKGQVSGVKVMSDGRLLSWSQDDNVWSKESTLRIWDSNGMALSELVGHEHAVTGAGIVPDGRILSWSMDRTLRLWDGQGEPLACLRGHTSYVNGAAVLADRRLVSWSDDGTLRLWDRDGVPLWALEGHGDEVKSAMVLDSSRILSWGDDGTLRLWSSATTPGSQRVRHTARARGITMFPDRRVLSWSEDGTLRIWDIEGHPLALLEGHTKWINWAAVLSDGRVLSYSGDGTLRVWESTGQPAARIDLDRDHFFKGATSLPDGRILSWSHDYLFRLWGRDGTELSTATRGDGPAEWMAAVAQVESANACSIEGARLNPRRELHVRVNDAVWHGDSYTALRAIEDDGTTVVTLDTGDVYCLKLHRGSRRVPLASVPYRARPVAPTPLGAP